MASSLIKWCIYLKHKSSSVYELLRSSNCVHLPSQRTLQDYTHFYESRSGFSNDLDLQLINDSCVSSLSPFQKQMCLLGDEMHIKEDLVYIKHTGELTGFCDMGDINEHLLNLEKSYLEDTTTENTLATKIVVRGLFINLTFPYASFPSSSLTGDQLVPLFYEAIMRLERCGFEVMHYPRWEFNQQEVLQTSGK